jgi:carbonic anhydrase
MKTVEIVYRYGGDGVISRARPDSAAAARERLERGNVEFAELIDRLDGLDDGVARQFVRVDPRELGVHVRGDTPSQHPFAAVLGCADARVPIELVFHEGPNDLFVVRVAGNVLGPDILGSLRYAMESLADGLRLIVVLGHSGCGAVSAAVDTFLAPGGYLALATNHDLRGIVDGLLVAVLAAANTLESVYGREIVRAPGYRDALVEVSVLVNAALGAHSLQKEIESRGHGPGLAVTFGVYELATRRLWAPTREDGARTGLGDPPADAETFRDLGFAAAGSARIRELLTR